MARFSIQEFAELLSGPLGSRMIRHIAVRDPARADLDRDKDVQDLERRGHRGEEVAGDDATCMIVKECRIHASHAGRDASEKLLSRFSIDVIHNPQRCCRSLP